MTPFKKDCKNIQSTQRKIFFADGSIVICKEMGMIEIPIYQDKILLGTLILDDVLIVPSLDRRLFSVNSFLSKGNNWVHFEKHSITLGLKDGPKVNIPITSLQSNALIVGMRSSKRHINNSQNDVSKKTKLSTNVIHDRFHRSHGAMATIQAHDLWQDVTVTHGVDSICTSCKVMTIPATSRGKSRTTQARYPLDEIQVDTVPNPEPLGLSIDSRYNYFLILCDRFSRIFRLIGIQDKTSEACIDGIELLTSNIPTPTRQIKSITHIRSDAGTEFRSDTFRKWCSEKGIRFSSAAPKHQEQNGLVERHWGTVLKIANTMLLHARLSKKFFYYAAKYAQRVHDVIPVKELCDKDGLPTTPYQLATNSKPNVRHYRVFGCPAIFKRYEVSDQGKRIKNKYIQQGIRGIFVGFPDDSAGWLFYVPSTKKTYISLDAVFDENFTSPLCMPDLPFQGALKIRNTQVYTPNTDMLNETTGPPSGEEEEFPNDIDLPNPPLSKLLDNNQEVLFCKEEPTSDSSTTVIDNETLEKVKKQTLITTFFAEMSKENDLTYSEYLCMTHDIKEVTDSQNKSLDNNINLSDFMPEPSSLNQVLRLSPHTKERWGTAIRSELTGLFDNDTFSLTDRPLPADEIIPTKLTLKTKLNSYGGLDKLKARICLRGDMQIKDGYNSWSPTASIRLLKCFIADACVNKCTIFQLDFIQAFIQSDAKKRMFVLLDKEYEQFCPNLKKHLGRPLKLKKCLYGADFSGKSWYETLDEFLTKELKFIKSRVEGCLYIYKKSSTWIKMINYVDDALYF